jgi:hypothetical protein
MASKNLFFMCCPPVVLEALELAASTESEARLRAMRLASKCFRGRTLAGRLGRVHASSRRLAV